MLIRPFRRAHVRDLPIPPEELRALVGGVPPEAFDNPRGEVLYPDAGDPADQRIFDFGCGCGRLARQLIQQKSRPRRYVGIDLHGGMISWCERNLASAAEGFEFLHHDVFNAGLNPACPPERKALPFPAEAETFDVVIAWSVFTHLLEPEIEFYLAEAARILVPGGRLKGTLFTFDKSDFPMLQDFQNALYVNPVDPTNAVIVDRAWIRRLAADLGLRFTAISAPSVRGFHWTFTLAKGGDAQEVPWPADSGTPGRVPPPMMPADAVCLGRE